MFKGDRGSFEDFAYKMKAVFYDNCVDQVVFEPHKFQSLYESAGKVVSTAAARTTRSASQEPATLDAADAAAKAVEALDAKKRLATRLLTQRLDSKVCDLMRATLHEDQHFDAAAIWGFLHTEYAETPAARRAHENPETAVLALLRAKRGERETVFAFARSVQQRLAPILASRKLRDSEEAKAMMTSLVVRHVLAEALESNLVFQTVYYTFYERVVAETMPPTTLFRDLLDAIELVHVAHPPTQYSRSKQWGRWHAAATATVWWHRCQVCYLCGCRQQVAAWGSSWWRQAAWGQGTRVCLSSAR